MPDRTKREIVAAFNRLIARSDMEKITTLRIAEEAEVSKATFYRYFRDKYDVLNYNYQSLLDHSLKQCGNYRDLYVLLYSFARDQWQNFTRAFNTTGINSFDNFICSYSRDVVEEITRQNRNGDGLTQEETLQLDVFCYGICYMYKKWTLGQYDLEPDAAADALYDIMPESLKHLWFKQARSG